MQVQNQKNMAQNAKTQNKAKPQPIISRPDCKKIVLAYYQLYRAFLLKNLLAGMTLGAASHNAMQLIRAKIKTMNNKNPVTMYLTRINARHTRRVTKRIMTSPHRDARATATPNDRARLLAIIATNINKSLNTFNMMTAQYKNKTSVSQTKTKQQLTLLQIKLKQIQLYRNHSRAA